MKTCKKCSTPKLLSDFRKRSGSRNYVYGTCKKCEGNHRTAVARTEEGRSAIRRGTVRFHDRHRAYFLIRYARLRAAEKGWAFDLDEHRAEIQARIDCGFCELTGFPLDVLGRATFNSPSLDRIDATKGYTYDNVRVICYAMNSALGNWGEENLYAVVTAWIGKRQRERPCGRDAARTSAEHSTLALGVI